MFSDSIPISRRKPTQNWCVVQTFRTFGIPTRTFERSLGGDAAERFFADQIGNVGKRILGLLHLGLDDLHLVQIFYQSLGAGVVNDHALPAFFQRNLAPLAALAAFEFHIDETALGSYRAPVADGVDRSRGLVGQSLDCIEAAELTLAA